MGGVNNMGRKFKIYATVITMILFVGLGCNSIYAEDHVIEENSGISAEITEGKQSFYFTPSKSGEYYLFTSGYAYPYIRVYDVDREEELEYETGDFQIGHNEYMKIQLEANKKYEFVVRVFEEDDNKLEIYCGDYDFAKNVPIKGEYSYSDYCQLGENVTLTPHIHNIFGKELSKEKVNFEYKWYKVDVSEDENGNEVESRGENVSNGYELNLPDIKQSQLSDETYSYYLCEVYLDNEKWDDKHIYLFNKELHYSIDKESIYSEPGESVSITPVIRDYKGEPIENPEKYFTFKWEMGELAEDGDVIQKEISDKYKLEIMASEDILNKGYWNFNGNGLQFSIYKDGKIVTSAIISLYDKNYVYNLSMDDHTYRVYDGDDIVIKPTLSDYKNQEITDVEKEGLKFVWYKREYTHTADYEVKNKKKEKIGTDSMLVLKNLKGNWYGCDYDYDYDHEDVRICCDVYKNGILVQSEEEIKLIKEDFIDNCKVPTGRVLYVQKNQKVNLNAEIYSANGEKLDGNKKEYTYEWERYQGNSGFIYDQESSSFAISKVTDDDIYANNGCKYKCRVYKDGELIGEETFYLLYEKEDSNDPGNKTDNNKGNNAGNNIGNSSVNNAGNNVVNNINEFKKSKVNIKAQNVKGKKVKILFKKVKDAKGYQIQYSLDKKFKKIKRTKNVSKNSYTIKKLKKKTYYIRVRAYVMVKGKKVYGNWSKIKKIKVKK